jgi:hypothetical protein
MAPATIRNFFSILAPDNTHLAPDLMTELGLDFTFYLKVAFSYRNGSFHSTLSWILEDVLSNFELWISPNWISS